jgi:hypothetical protein
VTPTLRYEQLEQELVDRLLAESGTIRVQLSSAHAAPLAALLGVARECLGWKHLPFWRRIWPAARALLLTARILLFHSKLLSLIGVVILNSAAQTWHRRPDGTVVFQFVRAAGEA